MNIAVGDLSGSLDTLEAGPLEETQQALSGSPPPV